MNLTENEQEIIIVIFGDSITHANYDSEGGWVGRLKHFLTERNIAGDERYFSIYNLGVDGDNSTKLMQRFSHEVHPRLKRSKKLIIVIAIGVNDSAYDNDVEARTPLEVFKKNIEAAAEIAAKLADKTAFIGLTPVDETKTAPFAPWRPILYYRNNRIGYYNQAIRETAERQKCFFIEVRDKINCENIFEDGLHLNADGYNRLFEIIKNSLLSMEII